MKILVCVKEIIDPDSQLGLSAEGAIVRDRKITYRMNRYDEFALEEAVQIKELFPGTVVSAVTVGPLKSRDTLRKALGKGADDAFHIVCDTGSFIPPENTARLIVDFAREKNFDLIFAGVMAEDDMYCQTGPLIAAMLGIPCAVSVISEVIDSEKKSVSVECEIEGGLKERIGITLPCLLAVQSGINRPRYPSLSNVLRAKGQEIAEIFSGDNALHDAPGMTRALHYPPELSKGVMLEGSREEKAERLASILHEKGLL